MRYGWNQNSLPTGATVTIAGSQARDGSMKAAVDTVTLPDGKRLFGAQDTSELGTIPEPEADRSPAGGPRRFFTSKRFGPPSISASLARNMQREICKPRSRL